VRGWGTGYGTNGHSSDPHSTLSLGHIAELGLECGAGVLDMELMLFNPSLNPFTLTYCRAEAGVWGWGTGCGTGTLQTLTQPFHLGILQSLDWSAGLGYWMWN